MKVSYNWLKDYLDLTTAPEALAEKKLPEQGLKWLMSRKRARA